MNHTGIDCYLNQRVARVDVKNKELYSKYVYYYMMYSGFIDSVVSLAGGSAQPNVSTKNIENLLIPLPPVEFQHSVLKRLDSLQSQLTALESLQRQSEDNARFILESYLGSAGSSEVAPEVEENKEDVVIDLASPTNEVIHPEEPAIVAPVKKVVKRKKPVVAKPLGSAGVDVITHEE
jgi:hypothetical protein